MRGRRGFTLVEIMVVVGIIGLLVAAVVVNHEGRTYEARVKLAASDMASIRNAVALFHAEQGRRPRELPELWSGERRYLDVEPIDPWGSPYVYESPTGEVVSHGADGAPGGVGEDADLSSTVLLRRQRRE